MRRRALALAICTTVVGVWPAGAADREHQQMMADIRILQEQTMQLQLMLHTLTQTLETVTTKLDEQGGLTRKAFADQRLSVEALSSDLRIVREKMDDSNVRISSLSQELEALRLAIPPPMPVLAPSLSDAASVVSEAVAGEPMEAPAPTPVATGMSPRRLYDTAWADYTAGQWALAMAGFETYIKSFPRSDMADNAQLFIGESLFSDGRFEDAVGAYDLVISDYAEGDAVPLAYYKRGLTLDRLDETERARESYEHVVVNFPDSDAGRLAKQALDRLDRPDDGL